MRSQCTDPGVHHKPDFCYSFLDLWLYCYELGNFPPNKMDIFLIEWLSTTVIENVENIKRLKEKKSAHIFLPTKD